MGNMDLIFFDATPLTRANFVAYLNPGVDTYTNNLFHRSAAGFVIQGGAFKTGDPPADFIKAAVLDDVDNEPGISNIRGTVAMACVPSIARSLMPKCIEHCTAKWPNVSFAIEDVAAREVIQKTVRGEIEFGISSGFIPEADLEIHRLMSDPFILVCRRDDAFAGTFGAQAHRPAAEIYRGHLRCAAVFAQIPERGMRHVV